MERKNPKRIAVVGSGIAGLTSAYLLSRQYDVTIFEAAGRLGGHTATEEFIHEGRAYAIDTGFIVFNDWTYPHFIELLKQLKVESQPTTMGFSVVDSQSGYEYAGANLNTLFAQRRNLFKLSHWRMLRNIVRFNREATAEYLAGTLSTSELVGEYLTRKGYSQEFIRHYLIPMGAAIWSSSTGEVAEFSIFFFVKFFHNHGLLLIKNRPQWRVIKGGSKSYIVPLLKATNAKVMLKSAVTAVLRLADCVKLQVGAEWYEFDEVVIAGHSDQALKMLADPSPSETAILGAIGYRKNAVALHTDTRLLPKAKMAWSSWNYRLQPEADQIPLLTYNMNILQRLDSPTTFCVTLNDPGLIDPGKILFRYEYSHPVFSAQAIVAQSRWGEINGVNKTWFVGAYWANGFHEDGVVSAIKVAAQLGVPFE